ncbi:MAG: branched-subunit amino acid aminotransferase/4-amino-4-deoxychorismate lyase [Candidatus Marinamargulisbacteria bacterium]|jgi:branched-subunit amino acid aminotransferase/4-amino-4-deoxychorismate lyase
MGDLDYISVNLEVCMKADLKFPYLDYGFLYGYGLFETVLVNQSEPIFLTEHYNRMKRGSIILDTPFPYEVDEIEKSVRQLISKNGVKNGVLNLYLTPGDRDVNALNTDFEKAFFLMVMRPLSESEINKKLRLVVRPESFQRTPMNRLKTLSHIKNILEKRLANGFDDVLLYDRHQNILETTFANAFFVKGNRLVTPKSPVIVPGVTRQFLINNQEAFGVDISLGEIQFSDLNEFDEIFLTNSLRGIMLVEEVDPFPALKSGPMSAKLKETYRRLIESEIKT